MKKQPQRGISNRQVRNVIKTIAKKNVSKEAVDEVKRFLDAILEQVAIGSLKKLQEENEIRAIHHAKRIKKITNYHTKYGIRYIYLTDKVLNNPPDVLPREKGQHNRDTFFQEAVEVTGYE